MVNVNKLCHQAPHKFIFLSAVLCCLSLINLSTPANANNQYDYATVIDVTPIIHLISVQEPYQSCYLQTERSKYNNNNNTGRNTLIGGLIGGVIGNALSNKRSHRSERTAAGAILGAITANNLSDKGRYGSLQREVCETRYESVQKEVVDGYQVVYFYNGKTYHTELPYHPGDSLKVKLSLSPVID